MYDAIIVGGRVSGAPLSMLLARAGHRVLCVEQAKMPSDTLSTHYMHPVGVGRLRNWGLLETVEASGCPRITRFEAHRGGQATLEPFSRDADGNLEYALCPRRDVLDQILWEAAADAGAEMRDRVRVTGLIRGAGGAVSGIEAQDEDNQPIAEEASLVVGADGLYSFVADAVGAQAYFEVPPLLCSYYSYWNGIETQGVETYFEPGAALLVFPTHHGQVNVGAAWPVARFEEVRQDIEGVFLQTVQALAPELSKRLVDGERVEPYRGIAGMPYYRRQPFGPGWALVGDAGAVMDSTLGLGMTKAFIEVDQIAIALDLALSGKVPFEAVMTQYQQLRDQAQNGYLQQNLAASSYIAGVGS